ncbi:MAG TPA: carboxypeptidase regulatory-like domain-containing protein, partial [Candidatus Eisenbacteria bacterium]|nr:carboxypeptidase regulatory-like domain-containing protein [Candidatus Eisenbacteria bacterium]
VQSGGDGRYAFALSPGSVTVTASAYAFENASASTGVVANGDQTLNLALRRLPSGNLSGVVRNTSGGALAGADVEVIGTPHRAQSDATGTYAISGIPEGTYTVRVARPGAATTTASVSVSRGKTTQRDFALGSAALYDDLEADRGWTPSGGSAFSGAWTRAVPVQKVDCDLGTEFQPGVDRTPDPGTSCFVTSNLTFPCFTFLGAVIGTSTLTSPAHPLAGIPDPRIGYWFWYVNAIPRVPSVNPFLVRLSNDGGATWVTAKTVLTSTYRWAYDEVRVKDFFPSPGNVLVQFVVQNVFQAVDATPEAAVDDITVYSGSGSGLLAPGLASASPAFSVSAPRPSPTRGATEIELSLNRETHVRADVFDLHGRLVTTALNRTVPSGQTVLRWDGKTRTGGSVSSGVYWMALRAGEWERKIRLVVVR